MSYTRGGHVFVLASALTHVHPGVGRSPGVVDLPVVRDPLGIPFIPGTSVKGAIKSKLAREYGCIHPSTAKARESSREGRMNCNMSDACKEICCLLGGEPGDENAPSRIAVTDLYPLLIPLPSLNLGVIFATSPFLVSKALSLAAEGSGISENLSSILSNCDSNESPRLLTLKSARGTREVYISTSKMTASWCTADVSKLEEYISDLNPVYSALGLDNRLIIVPDNLIINLADKSLVRMTRVRLRRDTKTVEKGGLWTEEYIPHTTLFSGAIIDTGLQGIYCDGKKWEEIRRMLFPRNGLLEVVIGGKESVGKGLVRIKGFQ